MTEEEELSRHLRRRLVLRRSTVQTRFRLLPPSPSAHPPTFQMTENGFHNFQIQFD